METPDTLLDGVRQFLQHRHLLQPASLLLVAVSGGPDSLCLLHILWRLRAHNGPRLHVAHLDHQFRGAQSAAEARFVAETAAAWDIPAHIEQANLPAAIQASGENKQAAARRARYDFLARVAHEVQASAVAVAHQADDQAETVLLHLLHGAGLAGLRGMQPVVPWAEWADAGAASLSPPLLRPLLENSRVEIEAYCTAHCLEPRRDPSNAEPRYTRSRIRNDLLPTLASYNPQIVAALQRTAALCREDYAYIQQELDTRWPHLATERPHAIRFAGEVWRTLPPVLQRSALRRAAAHLRGAEGLSYAQIAAGREAALLPTGSQHTLAHELLLRVEHGGFVLLHTGKLATPPDEVPQLPGERLTLPIPGVVGLVAPWQAHAELLPPPDAGPGKEQTRLHTTAPWSVILDGERIGGGLVLRRRQAGDRLRPAGGRGSRRVQDMFVDAKVPREFRAAWPIVVTPATSAAPERIVWVAGLRADEYFQATTQTRQPVRVVLRRREATETGTETGTEQNEPTGERGHAVHEDIEETLLSREQIQQRVGELGAQIHQDYADSENLLLVGVLKGCMMFMVDLAVAIDRPLSIDFIAISSYGQSTESSGVVRLMKDLDTDITGRHVLIVEDIIDSGLTLEYLRSQLQRRNPATLRICALLNKPERRTAPVDVDYIGFNIPNKFVVGYGLDYAEKYRNLPYIGVLKPAVYTPDSQEHAAQG